METKTVNYLFFLGGHDLEMVEIKNLLDQKNRIIKNTDDMPNICKLES